MQLRPYQQDAVAAALAALRAGAHPALQLPTGTGKSLVLAALTRHLEQRGGRVWVLTHVQELVEQNAATYRRYAGAEPAIVCAGLGRRELGGAVTFGTVQSVLRPATTGELPAPHLIIVDEAHRVPQRTGERGQYERVFRAAPGARRCGLTATPWRTDDGLIYGAGPDYWFDALAYRYTVPQAVGDGWLAPLRGVVGAVELDLGGVTVADDYVAAQVAERQSAEWLRAVGRSLAALAADRRHVAVYAPTVLAAHRALAALGQATGWAGAVLTGETPRADRAALLERFKSGRLRLLVSVDVLTTGFDFPALDCVVCLRPTVSSSLWVQIAGRGTRLAPGKTDCLLLDYVGNLQRLGGVELMDTYRRQRALDSLDLGDATPATPAPRAPARQMLPGLRTLPVLDPMTHDPAAEGAAVPVTVHRHSAVALQTRARRGRLTVMVTYAATTAEGARLDAAEFLDPEAPGAAEAEWEAAHRCALPRNPHSAARLVRALPPPAALVVRRRGRYWNVVSKDFNNPEENAA